MISKELTFEEMQEAVIKGKRGNFNFEQVIQVLLEYKERGETVRFNFNGLELCSDNITSVEETLKKYELFFDRESEAQNWEGWLSNPEIANLELPNLPKVGEDHIFYGNSILANSELPNLPEVGKEGKPQNTADESKKITPVQIGKATINAPTVAKRGAKEVENRENAPDKQREGGEQRDDN